MKYQPIQNYINGHFVNSSGSRKMEVISPVDGNLLSTVPMSNSQDLDAAVEAEKKLFLPGVVHPLRNVFRCSFVINTFWRSISKNWQNYVLKKMERFIQSQ